MNHSQIKDALREVGALPSFQTQRFSEDAISHLAQYILLFRQTVPSSLRIEMFKLASFQLLRKWSVLSQTGLSLKKDYSIPAPERINSLFLGDGVCTGLIVSYFSRFFSSLDPLASVPISLLPPVKAQSVDFYSVNLADSQLEEKTKHVRFLHAAYGMSTSFCRTNSLEFVPKLILNREKLELKRRLPDLSAAEPSFPISSLLPVLHSLEPDQHSGHLLGLGGPQNHAIAVYLQKPYHFFDPSHCLVLAESKSELLLVLANFLTSSYPQHKQFALLEFCKNFES